MRIALLTYSTRPRGGVVHTLALAEALAARGHDVSVWSLARGGDVGFFRPVHPDVEIRLVAFPDLPGESVGERILRSIALLGSAFDPVGYDVVHAQDCISANAVPRCIRTIHHLDAFSTPELVQCHERAIVKPYAHVCVSASVAREVTAGWGISPTVISNGIEASRFADAAGPGGADERAAWQRRFGRYVVCVGGIEPRKGTLDLIEAMAGLPDLQLVLAGGETLFDYRDYRVQVDDLADRLGVAPVVLGPVEHAALPTLVAGAEVFAFPSTKEGFGLAAMEALAAGVPVVMRDLPVLREVFRDAASFAATPAELAQLLGSARRSHDPERGAALAARYTWAEAAEAHERFYLSSSPS
jgi:glycosyltransferase-like protein